VVRKRFDVVTSFSTKLRLILLGAPPGVLLLLLGGGTPIAICNGGWPSQPLTQGVVGPAASKGGWAVNCPILWRLHQPALHVAAGYYALGHVTTAVWNGSYRSCRRLNRREVPAALSNGGWRLVLKNYRTKIVEKYKKKFLWYSTPLRLDPFFYWPRPVC
jgi:hypothetical protein